MTDKIVTVSAGQSAQIIPFPSPVIARSNTSRSAQRVGHHVGTTYKQAKQSSKPAYKFRPGDTAYFIDHDGQTTWGIIQSITKPMNITTVLVKLHTGFNRFVNIDELHPDPPRDDAQVWEGL